MIASYLKYISYRSIFAQCVKSKQHERQHTAFSALRLIMLQIYCKRAAFKSSMFAAYLQYVYAAIW